jgi:hypothetical protein
MLFNLSQDVFLISAPLTALLLVKLPGDFPVKFIQVDRVEALLELVILVLQGGQRLPMMALLGFMTSCQRGLDPLEDFTIQSDCLDGFAKLAGDFFFSDVLLGTLTFIASAVVINVLLFLEFCCDRATAMPTREQTLECPAMLLLTSSTVPFIDHHLLHPIVELS